MFHSYFLCFSHRFGNCCIYTAVTFLSFVSEYFDYDVLSFVKLAHQAWLSRSCFTRSNFEYPVEARPPYWHRVRKTLVRKRRSSSQCASGPCCWVKLGFHLQSTVHCRMGSNGPFRGYRWFLASSKDMYVFPGYVHCNSIYSVFR